MPLSNPASWVFTADYPTSALREERQGTTGFSVTVNPEGRVAACQVTETSGSPDLDEATCRLVTLRGRFSPALDADKKPVAGKYSNRIRWTIPGLEPPRNGKSLITFTVQANGEVTDCKATLEGAAAVETNSMTRFCGNVRKMKPYLDGEGKPVARKIRMMSEVIVE